ncbi:MAG: T9SS type A sorting domain-containing protein [Flavobacteriales bacterium]|nr:T9SS type A sorting domain-containing protein [Flavobacteriales bacterium]
MISAEVLGDLMAGHVFHDACDDLSHGDQITNWFGEVFQYADDSGMRSITSLASGDVYMIDAGPYTFDSESRLYTLESVIALASADPCLGCASLDITVGGAAIEDYTVECESDLDATDCSAAEANGCNDLPLDAVACERFQFDGENQMEQGGGSSQVWDVLTAGDDANFNNGPDALLQFYDINGDMNQATFFVEDASAGGVILEQFENGTAIMSGAVVDAANPSRGLNIHLFFEGRTSGADWTGGFKNDYGCSVTTDLWTMYTMNDAMSYATGRGDWQFGTLIHFAHQPATQHFGYQLGDGANNHNCADDGFSGWFSWTGSLGGESATGFAGDVIAELDPRADYPSDCVDGEYVELHYIAFDDACSIAEHIVQRVTRDDNTAPTHVSGGDDVTLTCDESDAWLADNQAADETVIFTDNCDDSEYGCDAGFDSNTSGFADGNDNFVCVELIGQFTVQYTASSCRTLERRWVATDCHGNQSIHIQTIVIEDNTNPVAEVEAPGDIVLNVNGACYADFTPSNTETAATGYSDNCDLAETTLDYADVIVDSTSTGCYSIIRTWTATATDSCGNGHTVSDDQRIDIQDLIVPSFAGLGVDTIECNLWGDCSYDHLNSLGLMTVTDNCEMSHVDVECTPLSSGCYDDYVIDYTATDMCGNVSTFQQIVVVEDTTDPTWSYAPADLTHQCSDAALDGTVTHNGTDYAVPVYTAGDGMAVAEDNCDLSLTVSYTDQIHPTECDQEYTIERTYGVEDCSNNTASHTQMITVEDTTAPEFTAFPADLDDVECDAVPAIADLGTLAAADNCDPAPSIVFVSEVRTDGICADTYTLSRTWETEDCAGNTHQRTQTIEVVDTTAPELAIDCPADMLHANVCLADGDLSLETNGEVSWTESDNCDDDVDVSFTYADVTVADCDADDSDNQGSFTITRTFTVTAVDNCGNTTILSCDQTLTFTDEESPEFDGNLGELYPAAIPCHDMPDPYDVLVLPLHATDNCDDSLSYEVVNAFMSSGSCPGTWVRTWTAYDDCGNAAPTVVQYVATVDTLAPEFDFCPDDITLQLDDNCETDASTDVTGMATVTDNCDDNPDVWSEDVAFIDLPTACDTEGADYIYGADDAGHNGSYQFTRVFYAEDMCENENYKSNSFCEHIITIEDNIAPSLSVDFPADRVELLDANCAADLSLDMVTGSASDNCDGDVTISIYHSDSAPVYTCDASDGTAEGSYTFTRSWTAIACDDSGNSTELTHDQQFNVNDEINPAVGITTPSDFATTLDGSCSTNTEPSVAGAATADASDNCDSSVAIVITYEDSANEYTCDGSDGNAEGSYTFTRTWTATATDDCGNQDVISSDQTITVTDGIEPDLSLAAPADQTINLDDLCNADMTTDALGYVSYETSDACDTDITVEHGFEDSNPNYTCSGDDASLDGSFEFDRTFTVTVTDDCGNTQTQSVSQHITVLDEINPTQDIETLSDVTLQLDDACSTDRSPAVTGTPTVGTADNCDSDVSNVLTHEDSANDYTCDADDDTAEGSYTFVRTWTSVATDDCGNMNTVSSTQTITVLDEVAPQFTATCDLMNGDVVDYACGDDNGNGINDILDFIQLPASCDVEFADNCDSDVALTFSSDTSGYVPTDEISNFCMPSTVETLANGETCDDRAPEAIRLFGTEGNMDEAYTITSGGSSLVEVGNDGSLHIVLETENADGTAGLTFDATYSSVLDWNEWLAEPGAHSYKKDCAEIFPGVEIWTDWMFSVMESGTMTGTGALAGSSFELTHQPMNNYYGLQIGEGANNKNENYGASAWFFYSGELVVDGQSLGAHASSGDIFMDLDCCLGWEINYAYDIVDDCGNASSFAYTDQGTGEFDNLDNVTAGGNDHTPFDISTGTAGLKDPIRITGLMPNPTNDYSQLGFIVSDNMRLRIDVYTMNGSFIQELFDGNATSDVQYVLDIDATTMSSGMYQIRLSSNDYVIVKKLLVSE